MNTLLSRQIAAALLVVCLAGGCSAWPWKKVPLDAASGFYKSASLTYRLDAGVLQQPLDVARVEGRNVNFEQVASSPLADHSIGTLAITVPHPAGRVGFAQARFTLASNPSKPIKTAPPKKSRNPFKKPTERPESVVSIGGKQPEIHEIWLLDIPANEWETIYKAVSAQGFFQNERPGAVGAQLAVRVNGTEVRKNWEQLPELNGLIQRVRAQGQLVAYQRPGALSGTSYLPITSPQVYSDLQASSGKPRPAGGPANAFSMPPTAAAPQLAAKPPTRR